MAGLGAVLDSAKPDGGTPPDRVVIDSRVDQSGISQRIQQVLIAVDRLTRYLQFSGEPSEQTIKSRAASVLMKGRVEMLGTF